MPDWYIYPPDLPNVIPNHDYGKPGFAPGVDDPRNTTWPWYVPGKVVSPSEEDHFYSLKMKDSPVVVFPLYFNGNQQLEMVFFLESFNANVYVAAQTTQDEPQFLPMGLVTRSPQGSSNKLFYAEALSNWTLLFSAVARGGPVAAKVSGNKSPAGWQRQSTPFLPDVNVVPANIGSGSPFTKWEQ